jgi:DNA-binding winged helix-turn-helix (wHTH) protein
MQTNGLLEFGPFRLDLARRIVSRGGEVVPLPSKAVDVLLALLQRPRETVTKEELMKAVWAGTFVEEGNLSQMIFLLRKALGDAEGQTLIVTVPRQGYRFAGEVKGAAVGTPDRNESSRPEPSQKPVLIPRPWAAAGILAVFAGVGWWYVLRAPRSTPPPHDESERGSGLRRSLGQWKHRDDVSGRHTYRVSYSADGWHQHACCPVAGPGRE